MGIFPNGTMENFFMQLSTAMYMERDKTNIYRYRTVEHANFTQGQGFAFKGRNKIQTCDIQTKDNGKFWN